ncbi:hypothetical protein WMY93_027773 [Mugilogobius chulae]|uniref:C-type lectin domain-containing protein n=1 Tax=Mugilogobius chulae TaxID=88201 RepID=A0AAW0N4Z8_9GOBI
MCRHQSWCVWCELTPIMCKQGRSTKFHEGLDADLYEEDPASQTSMRRLLHLQSGVKHFVLVNALMTWADSVAHCRQHYHDLAMIENSSEYQAVQNLNTRAWIGLYREPWRWSDNSNASFRNWKTPDPNNRDGREHCVIMNTDLLWMDDSCEKQLPFICYETLPRQWSTRFSLRLRSTADLGIHHKTQILNVLREELTMTVNISLQLITSPTKP